MDQKDWESFIERQMREALEAGKFDNLPGKGKPLKLKDNSFEDPAWSAVYDVLEDANFVPDWVEAGREIKESHSALRASLQRTLAWCAESSAALEGRYDLDAEQERDLIRSERRRAIARFSEGIEELNKQIAAFNLKVPSIRLQRFKLDVRRELERAGVTDLA